MNSIVTLHDYNELASFHSIEKAFQNVHSTHQKKANIFHLFYTRNAHISSEWKNLVYGKKKSSDFFFFYMVKKTSAVQETNVSNKELTLNPSVR